MSITFVFRASRRFQRSELNTRRDIKLKLHEEHLKLSDSVHYTSFIKSSNTWTDIDDILVMNGIVISSASD